MRRLVHVVDRATVELEPSIVSVDNVAGFRTAMLHESCGNEWLECRSRLERLRYRGVGKRGAPDTAACQRQNLPSVRVHHDYVTAVRVQAVHRVSQLALADLLERVVDRQHD